MTEIQNSKCAYCFKIKFLQFKARLFLSRKHEILKARKLTFLFSCFRDYAFCFGN